MKKESNYERVIKLRELHQPVFEALGIPGALYFPKMFYRPSEKGELYVSFFKSELQRGQDLFTEMVDRDFVSEDPGRQLYRWKYNPQWDQDYESTGNPIRYLVPVSELDRVIKDRDGYLAEKPTGDPLNDLQDCITDDCGMEEMSMKDLYCMIQNVPQSSKEWLNKLIRNNQPRTPRWPG